MPCPKHTTTNPWSPQGYIGLHACETSCRFCGTLTENAYALRAHIWEEHPRTSGAGVHVRACKTHVQTVEESPTVEDAIMEDATSNNSLAANRFARLPVLAPPPAASSPVWPEEGNLDIGLGEKHCQYCTGNNAHKEWKRGSELRRHVKEVHTRPDGDRPAVWVVDRREVQGQYPAFPPRADHQEARWPDEGLLTIESWERHCQYCTGDKALRKWRQASALRDHVRKAHAHNAGDRPAVFVARARNARTQQPAPAHQLVISDSSLEIMHDIHAQLHLRADVFDIFHLLIWRHILALEIPALDEVARTVFPRMQSYPTAVAPIVTTFLQQYGARLWPTNTRSHLTNTSRLSTAGFWGGNGPCYTTDGEMGEARKASWRERAGKPPNQIESVAYSQLGRLLRIYVLAALHRSLVDDGYTRAVTADSKVCLHLILVADQEPVVVQPPRFRARVEGSGPLAEALSKSEGQRWDPDLAVRARTRDFLLRTGEMGGLPREELQGGLDMARTR